MVFVSKLLTKLRDLKILEVSGVDAPANELDGWLVMKARGNAPDTLRKCQSMTDAEAWDVIVYRAAERAVIKMLFAEATGTHSLITEVERLSAALALKAKHSTRHPQSGQFIATGSRPAYTPGPADDDFSGALTQPVEPGTGPGNSVESPSQMWRHLGATLFTGV